MEEFLYSGNPRTLTIETVRMDAETDSGEEQRLLLGSAVFDEAGRMVKKREPRRTTAYEYDEKGNCIGESVFSGDGNLIDRTDRTFIQDQLTEELRGREKITFHYNSRGLKDYVTTFRDSHQESISSFGYDEQNRLIQIDVRDPEGHLLRSTLLERNEKDMIVREKIINQDNMLLENNLYEYPVFHQGNWLKRICYSLNERGEKTPVEALYRSVSFDAADNSSVSAERDISSRTPLSAEAPEERGEETLPEDTPSEERGEENGTVRFRNGIYRGNLDSSGTPEGTGVFEGSDGTHYSGEFRKGRLHGRGDLVTPDGRHYRGDFMENQPHGEGECLWPDGRRYKGNFSQGKMHGIGVFYWPDGSRFTGLFDNNSPTEQGLLESENDREERL